MSLIWVKLNWLISGVGIENFLISWQFRLIDGKIAGYSLGKIFRKRESLNQVLHIDPIGSRNDGLGIVGGCFFLKCIHWRNVLLGHSAARRLLKLKHEEDIDLKAVSEKDMRSTGC